MKALILLLLTVVSFAEVTQLECNVLETIKRSKRGYTQGFFIEDGKLYESTGGYGYSLIRRFDLKSQEVELSKKLPDERKGLGIVFDKEKLNIRETFKYKTEGWGITAQGDRLVMSDGSAKLYFLDPKTYQPISELTVTKDGEKMKKLNELEWVEDRIYANVWMTDEILQIDPESGVVTASIDCSKLERKRPPSRDAVLNGIAYDKSEKVFYLTGKTWKNMYRVRFSPSE